MIKFDIIDNNFLLIIVYFYNYIIYDSKILCLIKIETMQRVRYVVIVAFPK